jgi:hypothetical protein
MDPVRAIADAVLYEGYLLWPYRASALKNQRRFTFGSVFPEAWSAEHPDDRCRMRAEVVPAGAGEVEVTVRFLTVDGAEHEVGPGPFEVDGLSGVVTAVVSSRVTVELVNRTRFSGGSREDALRLAFCSAHAVLRCPGGFVSATDAPDCRNEGWWPVLVGEPGSNDTMLASPIILEDHPRIAPESPGDLFDGGEIDGLLTLNILSLTDEEKAEIRAGDPRGRALLERTEGLSQEQLMRLVGFRVQR